MVKCIQISIYRTKVHLLPYKKNKILFISGVLLVSDTKNTFFENFHFFNVISLLLLRYDLLFSTTQWNLWTFVFEFNSRNECEKSKSVCCLNDPEVIFYHLQQKDQTWTYMYLQALLKCPNENISILRTFLLHVIWGAVELWT